MEKKLPLQELSDAVAARERITKKKAEAFARSFFEIIEEGLLNENYVKIKSFGTFKIVSVSERESVNISTGERFQIDGHSKVSFTPDTFLKDLVNRPFAHFQTVVINEDTNLEELDSVTDEILPEVQEEEPATAEPESPAPSGEAEEPVPEAYTHEAPEEIAASAPEEIPAQAGPEEAEAGLPETPAEPEETETEEGNPAEAPAHPEEGTPETEGAPEQAPMPDEERLRPAQEEEDAPEEEKPQETTEEAPAQEAALPEAPATDALPGGGDRQKFNWWKAVVIFACILFLMILSYFAGYFRLFCPCEFEVALYRLQPAAAPAGEAEAPVVKVAVPATKKEKPTPEAPKPAVKEAGATPAPAAQAAAPQQATTDARKQTTPKAEAKPEAPVKEKAAPKKRALPKGQVKNGKYVITGTRQTYTMSRGETLRTVAEHVYGSRGYAQYIIVHNGITNPDVIAVGTVIKLPELELAPKDSSGSE